MQPRAMNTMFMSTSEVHLRKQMVLHNGLSNSLKRRLKVFLLAPGLYDDGNVDEVVDEDTVVGDLPF